MKLFVEGGGDATELKSRCRNGFREFISKAGILKRPRIIACGSRRNAYEDYAKAVGLGEDALLLVDSEGPVDAACQEGASKHWKPWKHLKERVGDLWEKPLRSDDRDCHLMVQMMETWLISDGTALKNQFGKNFNEKHPLAPTKPLEAVAKTEVKESLRNASNSQYGKGKNSFELLAKVDPAKVEAASPWAKRFVDCLKHKMDA